MSKHKHDSDGGWCKHGFWLGSDISSGSVMFKVKCFNKLSKKSSYEKHNILQTPSPFDEFALGQGYGCIMPLSMVCQLYRGGQFYLRKPEYLYSKCSACRKSVTTLSHKFVSKTTPVIYLIWWFIVLKATFSNISAISWRPALLVEEAGVPGENHRSWASNWLTSSLAAGNRIIYKAGPEPMSYWW
jgi:hypothetical protein